MQPSPAGPQVRFWLWQVIGTQASGLSPAPQTLCVPPPPHVWPLAHDPHWRTPPHLVSVTTPQLAPSSAHVEGHCDPESFRVIPPPPVPDTVDEGLAPPAAPAPAVWLNREAEQPANAPANQPAVIRTPRTICLSVRVMRPPKEMSPARLSHSCRTNDGALARRAILLRHAVTCRVVNTMGPQAAPNPGLLRSPEIAQRNGSDTLTAIGEAGAGGRSWSRCSRCGSAEPAKSTSVATTSVFIRFFPSRPW